ncbi:MAG: OmpA family protein [Saprospiraceae bacterium]
MLRYLFFIAVFLLSNKDMLFSQEVLLEGYVFEEDNRGFLNEVHIKVVDQATEKIVAEAFSNKEGFFSIPLALNKDYILQANKSLFFLQEAVVSTVNLKDEKKVFAKIQMKRRPGYLLELTLAENSSKVDSAISVTDTHIEVFNNTTAEQELDIPLYPSPAFKYTLQRGNHYTILIRKEGYFNKRIEAFVDVKGCIVCIDGVKEIGPGPGVSDNLTQGFEMGTLLANLELEKASLDKVMALENIYYDYNSSTIRPDAAVELDKVIALMKDNPVLLVELGSHTDARGQKRDNLKLSQARADAAVAYILKNGNIAYERLTAKGYGESQLVNRCTDDVDCTEAEHQQNRRTVLKIIGYADSDPIGRLALADIIRAEREEALLKEVLNGGVVQVPAGQAAPKQAVKTAPKTDPLPPPVAVEEPADLPISIVAEPKSVALAPPTKKSNYAFLSIPASYVGFKIEILSSTTYLDKDHKLFDQYNNVYFEQVSDSKYAYLIGHFKQKEDAQLYVDALLANEYPEANVVQFVNGKRSRE